MDDGQKGERRINERRETNRFTLTRDAGLQPCIFSKRKFHGLLTLRPAQKYGRFLSYSMAAVKRRKK